MGTSLECESLQPQIWNCVTVRHSTPSTPPHCIYTHHTVRLYLDANLQGFDAVGWAAEHHPVRPVKTLSDEVLGWFSVCGEVQ